MSGYVVIHKTGSPLTLCGKNGWFSFKDCDRLEPYESEESAEVQMRFLGCTGLVGTFEISTWPLVEVDDVQHLVGLGMRRRLAEGLVRLINRLDLEGDSYDD